jgi:hypothetical protein
MGMIGTGFFSKLSSRIWSPPEQQTEENSQRKKRERQEQRQN